MKEYNYKYEEKIDNIIKIKENNKIIENNYIFKEQNTNLSDILAEIRAARLKNLNQQLQQGVTTPTGQQSSVSPIQSTISVTPRNITNARRLGSPVSSSGVVYKYNRGVIGIEINGRKHEIILDGTFRHHNEATAEIGLITNCQVKEKNANPFINGMEISKQGTIIIQLEGDSMLVYLPEIISQEQYLILESEVIPRANFSTIAFSHGDDIYDAPEVNIDYLRNFYSNIVSQRRIAR